MKQLTCEMCGGTDLIKQDGAFVCQNCGMKYSIEEAKKMMIEGTVDVQGTVKVDTTDKLLKLRNLATRAEEDKNYPDAIRYYHQLLEECPEDWEPLYKELYLSGISITLGQIKDYAEKFQNRITNIVKMVKKAPEEKHSEIISKIVLDLLILSRSY